MKYLVTVLVLILAAGQLRAADFLLWTPAEMKPAGNVIKDASAESGQAIEVTKPFRVEDYATPNAHLHPGIYRLTVRVKFDSAADAPLGFQLWNPYGTKGAFRYSTMFSSQEFAKSGEWGTLTRTLRVGPQNGNYGMFLEGGRAGMRIESLRLDPLPATLWLSSARPEKLLYAQGEVGSLNVTVFNGLDKAQPAHLVVEITGGLDDRAKIYDKDIQVAAPPNPGEATIVKIPLPAPSEYGHGVIVTLRQGAQVIGTSRDYFYVSDHPVRIGHLGAMGIGSAYSDDEAKPFAESMRQHYFPMYEILFWAPDEVIMLTPPPGQEKWWSGQTLARTSTSTMKARIDAGHEQGMKVLSYTDLHYDYGFRIAEYLRAHPDHCDWDCNGIPLAYQVDATARQMRQSDSERFDLTGKPKFEAAGIWNMTTGNPALVDYHINQLIESSKTVGFDGFRYDDAYQYDVPTVDLLGRQLPFPGFDNSTLMAHLRRKIEYAKPGMIYGHNMEWSQALKTDGPPMNIDAKPYKGDYFSEMLRGDTLALQERWTAYMVDQHESWKDIAENAFRTGLNARRFDGHAYLISRISAARPQDGKLLTALLLAGFSHIAYEVSDEEVGYMRLACRYCDLLYGDNLVPILEPEKMLSVDAQGKEIWWKRYVRYRQTSPGHRTYLVHLINPPRDAKIGMGDGLASDIISNISLQWTLPAGWKANKAWQISGEGGTDVVSVSGQDRAGYDVEKKPLEILTHEAGVESVTVPKLLTWSMIALDCTGPEGDKAEKVLADLPPEPSGELSNIPPEVVKGDHSPNALQPLIYDGAAGWIGYDRKQMETVDDADTRTKHALKIKTPLMFEAYSPGEKIRGGNYRITFRPRSPIAPPNGAKIELSAWCPGGRPNAFRIHETFDLSSLTPDKGWQTFTHEVEMGYGWENFGVQIVGGFDGLLLDYFSIEEIKPYPEAKRLALQQLKPWPKDLPLTPHQGIKVWYGEGLYYEQYKIVEALKQIPGVDVEESPHYVYRETRGFSGKNWSTSEQLAAYDLVVLTNVDLRTLSLDKRDWLRGYVEAGGSLLLAGGPYGFGRGYWFESDLLEPIMPVKMHAFDLRPEQLSLRPQNKDDHFPQTPVSMWTHNVEAKPGTTVQLWAGDHPALVTWKSGKGKVAALMLTPLGEEPKDALVWWKWDGWTPLMKSTAQWLVNKP